MVISLVRLVSLPGQGTPPARCHRLRRQHLHFLPSDLPYDGPVNPEVPAPISIGALYMISPMDAFRALFRYPTRSPELFPGAPRIGVRVVSVRGDGAEISGAQVIDAADQLEPVRVRLT